MTSSSGRRPDEHRYDGPDDDIASGNLTDADFMKQPARGEQTAPSPQSDDDADADA